MRRVPALCALALALVALPVAGLLAPATVAAAQEAAPSGLRIEAADTVEHPIVEMTIIAPSQLVDRTLRREEVTVAEAGVVRPADVERIRGVEQQVVLVLDTSGSMGGPGMAGAREATEQFLDRVPEGTRVAVVAFATTPRLVVPFTSDPGEVRRAVAGLEADGRTALYDGVVFATSLFQDPDVRARTLVVLADGEDNASAAGFDDAADAMRRAGTSAYAVELQTSATDRIALQQLVRAAGGRVATTDDPAQLEDIYHAVAVEVASRYRITYRSAAYGVTDLAVTVDAGGVHQRVGGFPLHLPDEPAWRTALTSPTALLAGLLAAYVALGVFVFFVAFPRPPRVDLVRRTGGTDLPEAGGISNLAGRATGVADWLLRRRRGAGLAEALELAGLSTRPGEFLVMAASGALTLAAAGLLLAGPLLAAFLAGLVPVLAKLLLGHLARRRKSAFADQLDDTLQLLASSLRAGLSLMQAVQAVSRDAQSPTAEEFSRLVNETRLGRDLTATLDELAARMESKDFQWVGHAIAIHREVGGDLAEVLDTVGETIRDRGQMRRQVTALSAEGKLSAVILMGLPFAILAFLGITNPTYVAGFTDSLAGWAMLATAAVLLLVGGFWLRKMVQIEY